MADAEHGNFVAMDIKDDSIVPHSIPIRTQGRVMDLLGMTKWIGGEELQLFCETFLSETVQLLDILTSPLGINEFVGHSEFSEDVGMRINLALGILSARLTDTF